MGLGTRLYQSLKLLLFIAASRHPGLSPYEPEEAELAQADATPALAGAVRGSYLAGPAEGGGSQGDFLSFVCSASPRAFKEVTGKIGCVILYSHEMDN